MIQLILDLIGDWFFYKRPTILLQLLIATIPAVIIFFAVSSDLSGVYAGVTFVLGFCLMFFTSRSSD